MIILALAIAAVVLAAPFYRNWLTRRARQAWRDYDRDAE
jgi:hypothetical protein